MPALAVWSAVIVQGSNGTQGMNIVCNALTWMDEMDGTTTLGGWQVSLLPLLMLCGAPVEAQCTCMCCQQAGNYQAKHQPCPRLLHCAAGRCLLFRTCGRSAISEKGREKVALGAQQASILGLKPVCELMGSVV